MRCNHCGMENMEGAVVCANCGSPLAGGYAQGGDGQQGYDPNYAAGGGYAQPGYDPNAGYGQGGYAAGGGYAQPGYDPNAGYGQGGYDYSQYPAQDTSGMSTGAFLGIVGLLICLIIAEVVLFIAPGILTEQHYDAVSASSRAKDKDEDEDEEEDEDKDDKDKKDKDKDEDEEEEDEEEAEKE